MGRTVVKRPDLALAGTAALACLAPHILFAAPPRVAGGDTAPKPAALTDPRLQQPVRHSAPPAPLSVCLRRLQERTGVHLARAESVPDTPVLVLSEGETAGLLLRQLRLLMTDNEWQYQWAARTRPGGEPEYRLWRQPTDPRERRAFQDRQLRGRIAEVLRWGREGPRAWQRLAAQDPDLAERMGQPGFQARLALLARLSSSEVGSLLSRGQLVLPAARMAPGDQLLLRQAVGGLVAMGTTDRSGKPTVHFDARDLSRGEVVFRVEASGREPGALSLQVVVFTGPEQPGKPRVGSGEDLLYPAPLEEQAGQRKQVAAMRKQAASAALSRAVPGAKRVTIEAGVRTEGEEPPLAAYLRELSRQTGLTVLAHWPPEAPEPASRLSRSIVRQPVAEALDTLCAAARCAWVREGRVLRIRYAGREPGPAGAP